MNGRNADHGRAPASHGYRGAHRIGTKRAYELAQPEALFRSPAGFQPPPPPRPPIRDYELPAPETRTGPRSYQAYLVLLAALFFVAAPVARSASPSRAVAFQLWFAQTYNANAARAHWTNRITAIGCETHKPGFLCRVIVRDAAGLECRKIKADPAGDVLGKKQVACP